jgi:hypothetical protein
MKLEQSEGCGSITVLCGVLDCGQLPAGNTAALAGGPKHARRPGSISDASNVAEKFIK